jgi:hypothetical protein
MIGANQMSVYDRAQKTGFVAGPNHRMVRAVDGPPEQQAGSPAPNYREANDPAQTCSDCANYDLENRMCTKHNFQAKPQMVCDDFAPIGAEMSEDAMPAAPMLSEDDNF